jgi:hypothetical protein
MLLYLLVDLVGNYSSLLLITQLTLYSFSFSRTYLLSLPFSLPFGKNSTAADMPAMATLHSSPACH